MFKNHFITQLIGMFILCLGIKSAAQASAGKVTGGVQMESSTWAIEGVSSKLIYTAKRTDLKPICYRLGFFFELPYLDNWFRHANTFEPQTDSHSVLTKVSVPKSGFCKYTVEWLDVMARVTVPGQGTLFTEVLIYNHENGEGLQIDPIGVNHRIQCKEEAQRELVCKVELGPVDFTDDSEYNLSRRIKIILWASQFRSFVEKGYRIRFEWLN
jgi:hypothetical protein